MTESIPTGVIVAVDFGSVRIGVAACDPQHILSYPVKTVTADSQALAKLVEIIEQFQAQAIVVGYPLALDGTEKIATGQIRSQAEELAKLVDIPIWMVDERMTTAQARKKLRLAGRNEKSSRCVIDAQAAVGILETVLNGLRQGLMSGWRLKVKETHD